MKKLLENKEKQNNKGMTLVEVIVATAILSIVILPLLYSFVYTTRYNMKSREKQRATSAAEAIIEKFKGYPLSEIDASFDPLKQNFAIGKDAISGATFILDTSSGTDKKYIIKGVGYESGSGNAKYDALVTVKTHPDALAGKYTANFSTFGGKDEYGDAVYVGQEAYDVAAYAEAVSKIQEAYQAITDKGPSAPTSLPEENIIFNRKLEITISKQPATDPPVIKVKPELSYSYEVVNYQYKDSAGTTKYFNFSQEKYIEKFGTTSDTEYAAYNIYNSPSFKRLYVYYFPAYSDSINKDEIVFNNTTGVAVPVCLYKQITSGMENQNVIYSPTNAVTDLDAYEVNYLNSRRSAIGLAEARIGAKTKVISLAGEIQLYHNLDKNIGKYQAVTNSSGGKNIEYMPNGLTANNMFYGGVNNVYDLNGDGDATNDNISGTISVMTASSASTSSYTYEDTLYDINVKIYTSGSLSNTGTENIGARKITEIDSTFGGKPVPKTTP